MKIGMKRTENEVQLCNLIPHGSFIYFIQHESDDL